MGDGVAPAAGRGAAEPPSRRFGRLRGSVSVPVPVLLVALAVAGLVVGTSGPAVDVAGAVQPYAPRGVEVGTSAEGDWLAVDVRAGGFRPNSVVLLDVDGLEQRTTMADAAGVVEVRVPLPDRIGVRLRGIALDGGGIDLVDAVVLVRDGSVRRVVVLLGAFSLGLLLLLGWTIRRDRGAPEPAAGPRMPGTALVDEG